MEGRGPRVRFEVLRLGPRRPESGWRGLAAALARMEAAGGAPVLPDGYVGGNAAVRCGSGLLVSRSGRRPGPSGAGDFVRVRSFDPATWSAEVEGRPGRKPTADTPLHWAVLVEAAARFGWRNPPRAAIHGHLLVEAEGVPVSRRATTASTPADREALLALLRRHPWPRHRIWIRRGHGFFAVGASPLEALREASRLWRAAP